MTPAGPAGSWDHQPPDQPADLPAEQAVLGAILLSPDAASNLLPRLRAEQFHQPQHGELLTVMQHLHSRGEPVDPLTVHAELRRRGRVTFGERNAAVVLHDLLAATPTAANGSYYARIVAETAARRRAVEAGVRIVQLAGAGHGGLDQLMSDAARELACLRAAVERHHALVPSTREQPLRPADDRPLRAVGGPDVGR